MIEPLVRIECKECSMFFKVPDIPAGLCAMRNAWTPVGGGCMASKDLKKAPDKVTVIQCKDCRYRRKYPKGWYCGYEYDRSDPYEMTRRADDEHYYCADAERKEEEEC